MPVHSVYRIDDKNMSALKTHTNAIILRLGGTYCLVQSSELGHDHGGVQGHLFFPSQARATLARYDLYAALQSRV